MKKSLIVIAMTKWARGCDGTYFFGTKAASTKTAITRASRIFEGNYHYRNADSVEFVVEELTPEKLAAIIEGYSELTISERGMKNEWGEPSHSCQWYRLNSLRIATLEI